MSLSQTLDKPPAIIADIWKSAMAFRVLGLRLMLEAHLASVLFLAGGNDQRLV